MKRIIASLICVVLLLTSLPIMAAEEAVVTTLLNETFNDAVTNATPSSTITFGDGSLVQAIPGDSGKKVLRTRNQWEVSMVYFDFAPGENNKIVMETKVKVDDNNSIKRVMQYCNTSKRFTLVTRKPNGDLYDQNDRKVGRMPVGEWVKISASLNLVTLRFDLYVNDKLVTYRGKLQDPQAMTQVGFCSEANEKAESTMYCDYFRVYAGKDLVPESKFDVPAMNQNIRKTSLEHATQPKYKPSLLFDLDCEAIDVGKAANGVQTHGGSTSVQKDHDSENKYLRLNYTKGTGDVIGLLLGGVETYPSFVVQMDVRVNRKTKVGWNFICRDKGANSNDLTVFRTNASGRLLAADGETYLTDKNVQGKWVNVAGVIDHRTKEIDYYIDGELVIENFYYGDITTAAANQLGSSIHEVRVISGTSATGDHNLDLDNVLLYKAINYQTKEALRGEGTAMADSSNAIDYELDTTPLKPDMSAFTKVPESISNQTRYATVITDYSDAKAKYKDAICMVANNSNVWVKDGKYTSDYKFVWDGVHLLGPAPTLAAFAGKSLSYDAANKTATIGNIVAKSGDNFITVGGTKYESESKNQVIDGVLYIPVREYARYGMNKFYGESTKGFGVIAPNERPYTFNTNPGGGNLINSNAEYSMMMAYLILDRYNADSLKKLWEEKVKDTPYPRVLTIKDDAPILAASLDKDAFLKEVSDLSLVRADQYLAQTLNIPDVAGDQINGLPGPTAVEQLYYAYYITGNRAYIEKIWEFAEYIINLQNWNAQAHMLSTSWICLYLAYTYDLLRDELTQAQKDALVTAVTTKGIQAHVDFMYGKLTGNKWPYADYNWNVICNTGPMVASMVFLGEGYNDTLYLDCIEKAQVSLGYFMHYFAPDGGGWESPGYTNYLLSYMVPLLENNVKYWGDSALGLMNYPGFEGVGAHVAKTTANKYGWAIHCDDNSTIPTTALCMYFTKYYKDYQGQKLNIEQMYKYNAIFRRDAFIMLKYYMPDAPEVDYPEELDVLYSSSQIGMSRDAWGKASQVVLGVHGGYNNDAGMQVDYGNFFFEANGEVFADDTGREDYSVDNNAYPLRPEGHNLWLVNPDSGIGQNKAAYGKLRMVESKPKGVIYSLDMLPAYYGKVEAAERGFMLSNDRKVFTVQDEIKPFDGANEFYWFWHTAADIEIDEANKMVTLDLNGKKCLVYFDSNVDFVITKQDTLAPLATSTKYAGELQMDHARKQHKIIVEFYSEGAPVTFRAVAVPYGQSWTRDELKPIADWSIPDGSITEGYANTSMLYMNGQPIEGFNPDVYEYTLYYPNYKSEPVITADTDGVITEVIQRKDGFDTVVVKIASKTNPENIRTYTINANGDACVGLPKNATKIPIVYVTASGSDGNTPDGSIDGDMNTRWSASGDNWITLDLGSEQEINTLAYYVYGDDNRRWYHEIYVSSDNENFKLVSDDLLSTGVISDWEYTEFETVKARYVKIVCHGATNNPYNSITEFGIYNSAR